MSQSAYQCVKFFEGDTTSQRAMYGTLAKAVWVTERVRS